MHKVLVAELTFVIQRKYYVLMSENGKIRPVETILGMGGQRDKGE
jgi:hypothetical protein